jgi:cytochrome P450
MSVTVADPDLLASATPETSAAIYGQLRNDHPVYWSRGFGGWVVTRYADATAILRDPAFRADDPLARLQRLSDRGGPPLDHFKAVLSTISFFMDPPRHIDVRGFLSQVLQGLDMMGLRAQLRMRADQLIAAGRAAGTIDLAGGYGYDLALFAIHRLLGIPLEDCNHLAAIAREVARFFDVVPRSLRQLVEADTRLGELLAYFHLLIQQRRRENRDDGLSLMIRLAERTLGVSDVELAGFCAFFFVAGEETTGTGIARSSVMLAAQPALRSRLAAEPDRMPHLVREFQRLTSPFQYVTRIAVRDVTVAGTLVRAEQTVNVILASANRDPAVFADPDAIDLDRTGPEAIPFGYGAYRCIGVGLATLELDVAVSALLRCPDLRLAPGSPVWERRMRVPSLISAQAFFGGAR